MNNFPKLSNFRNLVNIIVFFSISLSGAFAQYKWHEIPTIPDQEGFAGMYAGVSHGVLIVAGGANFPDKKPWEGGVKKWYDHIYMLKDNNSTWQICDGILPTSSAYGISVSYGDEVIIVGGSDENQHYSNVFSLLKITLVILSSYYTDIVMPDIQ